MHRLNSNKALAGLATVRHSFEGQDLKYKILLRSCYRAMSLPKALQNVSLVDC